MPPRMPQVGDTVLVRPLGRCGVVASKVGAHKLRVALGAMTVVVAEADLEVRPAAQDKAPVLTVVADRSTRVPDQIDLHGMSMEEAGRAVEDFISRLALAGRAQAKIVHGLGSGRVQHAVHLMLGRLPVVRDFRVNLRNPGETDVYLG